MRYGHYLSSCILFCSECQSGLGVEVVMQVLEVLVARGDPEDAEVVDKWDYI